jgi:AcrR family transcriptional regulator
MSKKQAIQETAVRLFAAQGFTATTTVQVACEAKATEPMIYHHFKGKEELLACRAHPLLPIGTEKGMGGP